jgi:glyoxylase-like metal-dependent hydrolase (beta-lactamase superfamily II)
MMKSAETTTLGNWMLVQGESVSFLSRTASASTAQAVKPCPRRVVPTYYSATHLRAGTVLDVPGRPHAIEVPGHTPGSVAFHLPAHGAILTGDALVTRDSLAGRTGPAIVCAAFTHDTAQALASLDSLLPLDAALVLPGHGDPYEHGVSHAVRQAQQAGSS